MDIKSLILAVSPSIGNVSAECVIPEHISCVMTLAHGAGAGMNHTFMVSLANALAEKGTLPCGLIFLLLKIKKGDRILQPLHTKQLRQQLPKLKNCFLHCRYLFQVNLLAEE